VYEGPLIDANAYLWDLINHCASPIDRDAAGMARWRQSVTRLAEEPNIAVPVAGLKKSYNGIYNDLRCVTADLTPVEQRALFHDNAAKFYRIGSRERTT
jgi:predicted TIM-barrel fold metal-dependent hydrolase